MKTRSNLLHAGAGAVLVVIACTPGSPSRTEEQPVQSELALEPLACFQQIARTIGDLTAPGALHGYPCYRAYLASPGQPATQLAAILKDDHQDERVREIAAYAAHKLGPSGLAELGRQLLPLLRAGKVSGLLVEKAIIPGNQWSTTAAEHYDDPALAAVLTGLSGAPEFPADAAEYIRADILTGEARRHVEELRAHGQL
jgi:hypothetical protein